MIVQSVFMLSIILVVLKTFLKKIMRTKPTENSTLAIVINNNDNVYRYMSSIVIPTIKVYTYNTSHIISLVTNNLIKLLVFKKNKIHENQKIINQKFKIDCITII